VFAEALLPAIAQMEQEQWPLPDAGYELADDRGKVIAEAELAWPQARVAVLITDDDQDACVQVGWYAFTVEEFLAATVTTQDRGTIKDRLQGA
jgi:DEAD/DEAH box helicase domain-containing protein